MADGKQHKEVLYSGHVQGVGFRYTTQRIASRFDVVGFVRNVSDGRVQLVVEGRDAEVLQFLAEIATTFDDKITDTQVENGACADEFSGFQVRF